MAKRLEAVLAALETLRAAGPSVAARPHLEELLQTATCHGVARVADLVAAWSEESLAPALRASLDRFYVNPLKTDKGCTAKEALYKALVTLHAGTTEDYERGLRYEQHEPVWGGTADTAAGMRGLCATGLVQVEMPSEALIAIAPMLADPEMVARLGVIEALAMLGGAGADAVLRLKARLGDEEAHVTEACFGALVALSDTAFPFLAGFLDDTAGSAEAAAYALGASRAPQAVPILVAWWERSRAPAHRRAALLALANVRLEEAQGFLLGVVREGSYGDASLALEALGVHAVYDDALHAQIVDVVKKEPALLQAYERARARHAE